MSFDVSVVVPTFNRAHLLPATLDGIFAQTVQPSKVVLVDDGSTDDTASVAASYGSRLHYLRTENRGVVEARISGVECCTSPWIAFCDSDDFWLPEHLQHHASLRDEHPELGMSFSNFRFTAAGEWFETSRFEDAPPDYWQVAKQTTGSAGWIIEHPFYEHILRFQVCWPSCLVLSRGFYEQVGGFDPRFTRAVSEDLEFTLRCVQEAPVGVVTAPTVGIRHHGAQLSGRSMDWMLGDIRVMQFAARHHRAAWRHRATLDEMIADRAGTVLSHAFFDRRPDVVREVAHLIAPEQRSATARLILAWAALPEMLARPVNRVLVKVLTRLGKRPR